MIGVEVGRMVMLLSWREEEEVGVRCCVLCEVCTMRYELIHTVWLDHSSVRTVVVQDREANKHT